MISKKQLLFSNIWVEMSLISIYVKNWKILLNDLIALVSLFLLQSSAFRVILFFIIII